MAVVNGYITFDEFDSYLAAANNGNTVGTANRRTEMENAINAASRMIDKHCGRIFYDSGAAARVFNNDNPLVVNVPQDFHTVTSIKTDSTGDGTFDVTWSAGDYQLEPLNGVRDGQPGWPANRIVAVGTRTLPVGREARIEITASWGWQAVPADVKQACYIQSHRVFTRAEAPTGVIGVGEFGAIRLTSVDRDVETILNPYRRVAGMFV